MLDHPNQSMLRDAMRRFGSTFRLSRSIPFRVLHAFGFGRPQQLMDSDRRPVPNRFQRHRLRRR